MAWRERRRAVCYAYSRLEDFTDASRLRLVGCLAQHATRSPSDLARATDTHPGASFGVLVTVARTIDGALRRVRIAARADLIWAERLSGEQPA
jgi:hypothetical protein